MNCDIKLFTSKKIYESLEKTSIKQLFKAAKLPGVLSVVGMPDLHQGYGLPIGGVMATDLDKGVISPGAVGFDINCGVRLLKSNIPLTKLKEKQKLIINKLKKEVPAGLGTNSSQNFSSIQFKYIVEKGIPYIINILKEGNLQDVENCEDQGVFKEANLEKVSKKAVKRGIKQLGTLGSGNHFLEIQKVHKVFDSRLNLNPGCAHFMLHTGSRGFGHQIARDYIEKAKKVQKQYNLDITGKNLASFPINSTPGQKYYKAMGCAANFAYANRHFLTLKLRKIIKSIFPEAKLELIYDITHNLARKEEHFINNRKQKVIIHRKGATRLNGNNMAIIPGSMGTSSFIVKSCNSESNTLALKSTAHGAGRIMGRRQAKKNISPEKHRESLGKVKVISASGENMLDESPLAYKNIESVIESLKKTKLAQALAIKTSDSSKRVM